MQWERSQAAADSDGWEIKRTGDKEVDVRIVLFVEQSPSKVKLSPNLAMLLQVQMETRPRILFALWNYIKVSRASFVSTYHSR